MQEEGFWNKRYLEGQTGWDIGFASTPLKDYIDQLQDKDLKVLIPGAGNAYEAGYLWQAGYKQTHILDISSIPLKRFKTKYPDFPDQQIHHDDFFVHDGRYDLILEQTFFCTFHPSPENRKKYAHTMKKLLNPGGKLVGVWFSFPLSPDLSGPPFGGSLAEYITYFESMFDIQVFEPCKNSIPPRQGFELFAIMPKK